MKQTSDTSLFFNSQVLRKNQQENAAGAQLFLGHKLLGELKILMRLSSGAKGDQGNGTSGTNGEPSY